jgi:hypothetical protein
VIRLTKTDGGKLQDGFSHETNDCGVRALALSTGMTYAKAHGLLKAEGRRDRKGTKQTQLEAALKNAGIEFAKIIPGTTSDLFYGRTYRPSLNATIRKYNEGRYLVITNRHGLTLIDGIVHDVGQISGPRTQVRCLYKILTPVAQPVKTKEVPVEAILSQAQINELWARLDALEARRKAAL